MQKYDFTLLNICFKIKKSVLCLFLSERSCIMMDFGLVIVCYCRTLSVRRLDMLF